MEMRLEASHPFMQAWLVEGLEYLRPTVIFQLDIQLLGIQSQFFAINFLGPQTTMIRIKSNLCTYLLVVFFDSAFLCIYRNTPAAILTLYPNLELCNLSRSAVSQVQHHHSHQSHLRRIASLSSLVFKTF